MIIPGVPHDVALLILALLPRSFYSALSLVCRSWRYALRPEGPVMALRKRLNISDTWLVFLSLQEDNHVKFLFVDPAHRASLSILPSPYSPYNFHASQLSDFIQEPYIFRAWRPMIEGSEIFFPHPDGKVHAASTPFSDFIPMKLHCFDAQTMQWKAPVCLYANFVCCYATVAQDECAYVVGGISLSSNGGEISKRVAKFNIRSRTCEVLPDMQEARLDASAVFLQGHLCIVGGGSKDSGEIWDPSSRTWTFIPGLWPASVYGFGKPCIASLKGRLYALRYKAHEDEQELMYYEDSSELWISTGKFCFPALVERAHSVFSLYKTGNNSFQIVGVDEELLIIYWALILREGRKCMAILSGKPTLSKPITWEIWPLNFLPAAAAEPHILHV